MKPRLQALLTARPELTRCQRPIMQSYGRLERCFRSGGRLYLCGNGGSAADCEHWAGELLKGFYASRRPKLRARLPRALRTLQDGLPAIPLTGFLSLRTAALNDLGPGLDFAQLVWALGRRADVLVAISTSGNARNVLNAARAARIRKMEVIGLTGEHGGQLRALCDTCICAPASLTHLVQEFHLSIYHALCLGLEDAFFR